MSIEFNRLECVTYTLEYAKADKEDGNWEVINVVAPGAQGAVLLYGQLRHSENNYFGYELQLYPYGFQDYFFTLIDGKKYRTKSVQEKLDLVADLIDNRETKLNKIPYEKWKEIKELMPHKSLGNDRAKESTV